MSKDLYEKLGLFYLGKKHDQESGKTSEELVLYDSKDLTTHAVCVGMTGSGKTGLCVSLLEEAAIDGIPAIAIDPKGDLGNLMLTFPELKASDFRPWVDESEAMRKGKDPDQHAKDTAALWKKGLAQWGQDGERITKLKEAADVAIYTPGGSAGLPLTVLRSFSAPSAALLEDTDAMRDRVQAAVSGLLALLGIDADPVRSREHILLSNILDTAWRAGRSLDLAGIIREVQKPPFEKVGVFDLESFFPQKERMELSLSINSLLASPGFSAWMEGESLDIGKLLYTEEGKPRLAIMSIAHLSESERMFFVTILLNEVLAWIRTQPGTSSLRALLYMDEIFGYFPPTANPPSKQPMLTLLKQARAYGLGVVLATQNPVDLDYKGLSNTGTWLIGRLQTERDKMRVLDGLEGASNTSGKGFDRSAMEQTLAGLGGRVFLMHNVHEEAPCIFHTRWAMSYLRGPLTRTHIQTLMEPRKAQAAAKAAASAPIANAPATAAAIAIPEPEAPKAGRPVLPPGIDESFLGQTKSKGTGNRLVYRPRVTTSVKLHYALVRAKTDCWISTSYIAELPDKGDSVAWDEAVEILDHEFDLEEEPMDGAEFAELPAVATNAKIFKVWEKEFKSHIYQNRWMTVWSCKELKEVSKPGETEGEFRGRLSHLANEKKDLDLEKLRATYGKKFDTIQERIRKAEQKVEVQKGQLKQQTLSTVVSIGTTLLGAVFGRKSSALTKAGTAVRRASSAAREKGDIARAKEDLKTQEANLKELEGKFEQEVDKLESSFDPQSLELTPIEIKPKKTDITVTAFDLTWTPWRVTADGIAEPLFD